jgi:predicted HNH restriction endonuclease
MEETKKCIPLCANCHRILHWEEAKQKKLLRKAKKAKKAKM